MEGPLRKLFKNRPKPLQRLLKGQETRFNIGGAVTFATGEWDSQVSGISWVDKPVGDWPELYKEHYVEMIQEVIDRVAGMEDTEEMSREIMQIVSKHVGRLKGEL